MKAFFSQNTTLVYLAVVIIMAHVSVVAFPVVNSPRTEESPRDSMCWSKPCGPWPHAGGDGGSAAYGGSEGDGGDAGATNGGDGGGFAAFGGMCPQGKRPQPVDNCTVCCR